MEVIGQDGRIHPTHIALYLGLLYIWKRNRYQTFFPVDKKELMNLSAISGRTTYQRRMNELRHWNYIDYTTSFNRYQKTIAQVIIKK